jgi:hypothetical protein
MNQVKNGNIGSNWKLNSISSGQNQFPPAEATKPRFGWECKELFLASFSDQFSQKGNEWDSLPLAV